MEGIDRLQTDALNPADGESATLVIHTGGIGDLLLAAPAIEHLARSGPLHLAGIPERAALLQQAGVVSEAFALDRLDFASLFSTPSPRLATAIAPYDHIQVWMKDGDGVIASGLASLTRATVACMTGLPPEDFAGHATDYYCACVGASAPTHWQLPLEKPASSNGLCFIHPGSGSPDKNWPLERFQALAQRLEAMGERVCWIGGPAEEGWQSQIPAKTLQVPLTELAPILAGAGRYIGNDSGITHLASVLGVPAIALFGPTNSRRWRPIGPRTKVIQGQPWPAIDEVFQATTSLLHD